MAVINPPEKKLANLTSVQQIELIFSQLKGDEFNSNALSNAVASFFVIVLLVDCEKAGDCF